MKNYEEEISLCKRQIIIQRKRCISTQWCKTFLYLECIRLENKCPVIVFLSNSSSFTAFVIKSALVELPLCFLLGGPLCCHLTFRRRMRNHDSQVSFLSLLLICCDLETRSCITAVYDHIICQVRVRTLASSKHLWLKLIKLTEMFEQEMVQKVVQQAEDSD